MKNFCYLLFLFTAFPIFSADWEPYPLNQKSYYQSDKGIVYVICADSILIEGDKKFYLLNGKFEKRYDKCDSTLRKNYHRLGDKIFDYIDFGHRIEVNSEYIRQVFKNPNLLPFVFYGSAQKGFFLGVDCSTKSRRLRHFDDSLRGCRRKRSVRGVG